MGGAQEGSIFSKESEGAPEGNSLPSHSHEAAKLTSTQTQEAPHHTFFECSDSHHTYRPKGELKKHNTLAGAKWKDNPFTHLVGSKSEGPPPFPFKPLGKASPFTQMGKDPIKETASLPLITMMCLIPLVPSLSCSTSTSPTLLLLASLSHTLICASCILSQTLFAYTGVST